MLSRRQTGPGVVVGGDERYLDPYVVGYVERPDLEKSYILDKVNDPEIEL